MNVADAKFKTKPYRHQIECLQRFGQKEVYALLAEQGTGKTWIEINDMAIHWGNGQCDAVLIFAPNGVHKNWTRFEFPQHMPEWCRYKAAAWSSDPNREEKRNLENLNANAGSGELRILTMNWDALSHKHIARHAEQFCASARRLMVIADESDAIKNPDKIRSKSLFRLKKYSFWRRIMSGTPVNNSPFDLWNQFNFLDEHILDCPSFYAFKAEYAELLDKDNPLVKHIADRIQNVWVRKNMPPQIVATGPGGLPKYRNLDRLSKLIDPFSFRVLKKDCLDLPKKIYKTVVFQMTKEQQAVYKKAQDECRLVFEETTITFNRMVAVSKLAQITSGYYKHPSSEEPVRIPGENRKIITLMDRVDAIANIGKKIIIWARFQIELDDIAAKLKESKLKFVEYHGRVPNSLRMNNIEEFERGSAQVFLANQQTGGTGITLVAAHNVFYFSQDWSYRARAQSEDRAHRIGQEHDVIYTNICAENSIDEDVNWALLNKQDVADTICNKGLNLFRYK